MSFAPRFTVTHPVTAALTRIERARGFLEAAQLSEDWIRRMGARALVLEAHHTTHIEGTRLTLEQSERLLAGETVPEADPDDVRELLNYRGAFEFVSSHLGDGGPITEGLIREIHKRLVGGVRGGSAAPGGVHPVLASGVAQFQLVHIHPFLDGNGRTSRLLSTLCLYRAGYDFKRLFTISEYYDRDRPAFYRAIQSVRERAMDVTGWVEFFTDGLATQLDEVKARGERAIRRDVLARQHSLSDRQALALGRVLDEGRLTIQELEALCPRVNRRTLQRDLKTMVDKGLLVEQGTGPTDPTRHYSLAEAFLRPGGEL
jgi:Fic family protein